MNCSGAGAPVNSGMSIRKGAPANTIFEKRNFIATCKLQQIKDVYNTICRLTRRIDAERVELVSGMYDVIELKGYGGAMVCADRPRIECFT